MTGMSIPSCSITEIPEGANILDVREDDEFAAGHIDGAQHIRLSDLPVRYGEVPMDEDVYVICRSGGRSRTATEWLNKNGFLSFLGGFSGSVVILIAVFGSILMGRMIYKKELQDDEEN